MLPVTWALITAGVGLGSVLGTSSLPSASVSLWPGSTSISPRCTVNEAVSPVTVPLPSTPVRSGTPFSTWRATFDTV